MDNLASPSAIAQAQFESFSLFHQATAATIGFARWLLAEKTNLSTKKFTALLAAHSMTRSAANRYLRIAIAFGEFSIDQIQKLGILDLDKYAANRFTEFRKSLIDLAELTPSVVAELAKEFTQSVATKPDWLTPYLILILKTYTPEASQAEVGTVVGDSFQTGGQLIEETRGQSSHSAGSINIWKRDATGKRYWEIGKCGDRDAGVALQLLVKETGKLPQTIASMAIIKLAKEKIPTLLPIPVPDPLGQDVGCEMLSVEKEATITSIKTQAPSECRLFDPAPPAPPAPPAYPDDTWQQAQNELETHLEVQAQHIDEIEQIKREIENLNAAIAAKEADKKAAIAEGRMYCPTEALILRIEKDEREQKLVRLKELEFFLPVRVLAHAN
ncbi:hypothetical protein FD723_40085 (plasmid) [Nostoc sp. C052]|uniref:hypothetical protein n=1 Tax=Nostoc sp. C052 TaxID=2576902 RepID=UPI0015C401FF|nr:hypothetical protein [Nostoc sp. C052]QLE46414.1 hypothetical protein FD723_40085 [Nostoc sp. C052]